MRSLGVDDPPTADADGNFARGPAWLPAVLVLGLYVVSVIVYILLGRGQALPQVAPDEYQYSAVARSLADGNGMTYNCGPIAGGLRAARYIYVSAPACAVTDSLTQSYAIAKAIGAILLCTVVFPTWLLARRFMPALVALVPAVLIVAGSWMTSSGQMIFENLALPLAAASLTALVAALARPGSRWLWIAFAFALVATWSRAQMALLIPIVLLALVVDIAAQGHAWRERARSYRWPLGLAAAISLIGGIAVLADPTLLGSYAGLKSQSDVGRSLPLIGRQSLAFIAMSAVLPLIVAIAVTFRRPAWGAEQLRTLLIVFWVATITFVVATGILTTGFPGVDWSIQRYVEYSLPLLYILVVAGIWRGLVGMRLVALATTIVAGGLLLTPEIQNIQEQRGTFGLVRRADQLLGVQPGLAMALVALVSGGVVVLTLFLTRRATSRRALLAVVVVVTGLVFAVQDQAGWNWQINQSKAWRAEFPSDLSWIDRATDEPVGRLVTYYNPFRTPQTEFFNRRIARTYVSGPNIGGAPVNGFTCTWSNGQNGEVNLSDDCGPAPNIFFLNDDIAKMTFYDQRVIAQRPNVGRVVAVGSDKNAPPRLKAVVSPPCTAPIKTQNPKTGGINPSAPSCNPGASGQTFLDAPGRLVLSFEGGQSDQRLQLQTSWSPSESLVIIPAGQRTNVTMRPPAGPAQWRTLFDWQGVPPAVPRLVSAQLTQGRTTTELLY